METEQDITIKFDGVYRNAIEFALRDAGIVYTRKGNTITTHTFKSRVFAAFSGRVSHEAWVVQ